MMMLMIMGEVNFLLFLEEFSLGIFPKGKDLKFFSRRERILKILEGANYGFRSLYNILTVL